MHLKSLLSASLSLAYLATTTIAAATDLDLISPSSLYNSGLIERSGWSLLDARQEPTTPSPPTPADPNDSNTPRLVQIVKVSDTNGSLKFFPEKVTASVGDVIQFHFYPKNHTITEGLFTQPCKPLPDANKTETRPGQKSGFVPVTSDTQFRPIYNMILNDTKPMWIFCGQTPHCQKGMVMVINQNETDTVKTLENYRAAAMAVPVPAPAGATPTGSSSVAGGYGAPSSAPPAPPIGTGSPAATATSAAVSTYVPAGPSLIGSSTAAGGVATASIAPFTGGASRDLGVWGSTWSVGLLGVIGIGVGLWL